LLQAVAVAVATLELVALVVAFMNSPMSWSRLNKSLLKMLVWAALVVEAGPMALLERPLHLRSAETFIKH
jgi:hypothetical protein